ncbi:glutamine--fructose-6-phosphate transaminase (isomerizing) [Bacterioplanes sanyensis]|uniref:Glutamine--fructose-6-phosphate aminotransferase [isomerizing] n=1 Tax=Bacterioplanes sanyensis TaxID=1249553 RepID=A0A222FLV7_9GAMM|nr:glutamine--fructose-6-phosphate transaminase (isomerizing) [Bacterioplanes sanyensis]ASP39652.1 glutamine--fructose-6-phosphate transaminase (isomerizing) [Bacterioplanes sanyensis]
MCGIFGATNGSSVTSSLLAGLEALAYRGYDSSGIAIAAANGLQRRRAEGKIGNLQSTIEQSPVDGNTGIGHTRWATHGRPDERNAHPHMTEQVAVVHNGIIENYQQLRLQLQAQGVAFDSDTDSEVIPRLISQQMAQGLDQAEAIRASLQQLKGSFAIAAIFSDSPDCIYAARMGSPLVIGKAHDAHYLASDSNALASKATLACHLEDGDLAYIRRDQLHIHDHTGALVERPFEVLEESRVNNGKQGYAHYMLKEMHEQPGIIEKLLHHYGDHAAGTSLDHAKLTLQHRQRLGIVACGSSYYAGMVGKYWLESIASLPVDLDIASEFRYRNTPLSSSSAHLFISQSGETADTLAALRYTKQLGITSLSLVNAPASAMARESAGFIETLAGAEIGVASTKAFTAQLMMLALLTLRLAESSAHCDAGTVKYAMDSLRHLPEQMRQMLKQQDAIQAIAGRLRRARNVLYIGRGMAYPLALEGALKLKEISYIHAEAYPAGELKHGPIALVDDELPVIVLAPPGELQEKTLSNLREIASRGAQITLISDQAGVDLAADGIQDAIVMPDCNAMAMPMLYTLPLQLLAYRVALLKGTDIDQPRNLAKSVTVE